MSRWRMRTGCLARDLIEAIEQKREPISGINIVRYVTEICQGVYASHLAGGCRL